MNILGIDLSSWQDDNQTKNKKVNFHLAKSLGVDFVFIKASQNNFIDEDFKDFWLAAKEAGLYRGAYHFYDYRDGSLSPGKQAETLLKAVNGDFGELGLVLDYENLGSVDLPEKNQSMSNILSFMKVIENETKEDSIFYSNLNCITNVLRLKFNDYLASKPLWLAWYPLLEPDQIPDPTTIKLPRTPVKPKFWQFTFKLDGLKYGAESKTLDGNFYFGDSLQEFRGRGIPIIEKQELRYQTFLPQIMN